MADASKAHKLKLANSRKRFKELQELKKKKYAAAPSDIQDHDVQEPTPADSLTSSTHSSINAEQLIENSTTVNTPLPNYFTNTEYADNSVFFDTISQKNNKNVFNPEIIETPTVSKSIEDNYSLFNQTNVPSYVTETQQIIRPNADSVTIDDPEIRPNEIFEHHQNTENNLFSEKNRQNLIEYLQGDQHSENVDIKNENVHNVSKPSDDFLNSSPMQQFVHEYNDANSITDLEKRNIELTTLLENERTQSQDQKLRIAELEDKVSRLEGERALKEYNQTEINNLREELQCHTQTIRLLVAEKTELSNALTQLELNFKNKNSECDELQARLKASRSRAFEFEQELNGLKSERVHKETNGHDQNVVIENLKTDFNKIRDEKEELHQDLLEVREKLKSAIENVTDLQKSNSELSGKLSLADVKIQQLASADHRAKNAQVEQLVQRTVQLENEVAAYEDQIKNVSKELNESTNHYQRYTEDLNSQLATIQEQYQQLLQENENLSLQEQSRVRHISDLERQLQSIQNDRVTFSSTNLTDSNLKNELDVTRELCIQLQMEKTESEENYTKALNEKEMLLKELSAKNDSLSQLESMVEQLRGNQPDSVKLLAAMESDKVAAARAVQQNKDLKEQLESMTEVFAKMDNDKVELTEKLNLEQSSNKDLLEKLQKTELQLQRLTDAIEIKDRELSHLRETSTELNKQMLQQEQLNDRLRHYEANDNSSISIQNELQEAKQTIVRLTNELNNQISEKNEEHKEISSENDILLLRKTLTELELKNQELETKLENNTPDNNNVCKSECNDECIMQKEEAMKRLEEKVKKTMQDIADLTEEKQRLEHLVLQLQGETETIGEYVALYQHQRMVLKQKAVEKDEQLKQLATDREQIKVKLEKLNQLLHKMLNEKSLHPDILGEYQQIQEHNKENYSLVEPKVEAAEEILALLSEIKSSNLVEPKETFHHCPFCSGQLLTV